MAARANLLFATLFASGEQRLCASISGGNCRELSRSKEAVDGRANLSFGTVFHFALWCRRHGDASDWMLSPTGNDIKEIVEGFTNGNQTAWLGAPLSLNLSTVDILLPRSCKWVGGERLSERAKRRKRERQKAMLTYNKTWMSRGTRWMQIKPF